MQSALRLATRCAMRSCQKPITACALLQHSKVGYRMLSVTSRSMLVVKSELISALENEIGAEKQLEEEHFGDREVPKIVGFQINANDAEIRLTKTYGNERILVVVNVNHSVDIEDEFDDSTRPQDEEIVPVALPPVTIEIIKDKQRLCFHLDLVQSPDVAGKYDFRVEEFYIATVSDDEDVPTSVYASSGRYIDPSLHELLFVRYLEERGFDATFCQELVNFATHYEHARYVSLLDKIKAFVSK